MPPPGERAFPMMDLTELYKLDKRAFVKYCDQHRNGETWEEFAQRHGVPGNTLRGHYSKACASLGQSADPEPMHTPKYEPRPRVPLNAAVFDIETTDLQAVGNKGFFICGCILPLNGGEDDVETYGIRYEENDGNDRRAVMEYVEALCRYDVLIGHYTHVFDFNWLHTRYMKHKLAWPRTWLSFDTCMTAKTLAIKARKKLVTLCDFYEIPCIKTAIYEGAWNDIRDRDTVKFQYAYNDIVYHCQQDVIANRNLFDEMYPYAMALPGASPFKLTKWRVGVPGLLDS